MDERLQFLTRGWLCALWLLAAVGCGNYDIHKQSSPAGKNNSQQELTLSYETVRDMVLQPNCFGCHSAAGGSSGDVNFETYANTFPHIQDILSDVSTDDMPASGPPVPANEKTVLFAWINAGAPETSTLPMPAGSQ